MYRSASSTITFKQRVQSLQYPLYVTFVALIGTIFCVRLLSDYTWRESVVYGTTLVLSFWLGQLVVGLMTRAQHHDRA